MRLYFLVLYNLSTIQKGIQAGHAALEYAERFSNTLEYRVFVENHKTWIILDVGGSQDLAAALNWLSNNRVNYSGFIEPDLYNNITALAFLVPEKIYNGKKSLAIEGKCPEMYFYPDGEEMNEKDAAFFNWLKQYRLAR